MRRRPIGTESPAAAPSTGKDHDPSVPSLAVSRGPSPGGSAGPSAIAISPDELPAPNETRDSYGPGGGLAWPPVGANRPEVEATAPRRSISYGLPSICAASSR